MPSDLHDAVAEKIMCRISWETEHQCPIATHIGDEQRYGYGIFLTLRVLQREPFSGKVRSIGEWELLRSRRTAYCIFPDISPQNPFAHAHWEVLTPNNPLGRIHEIDSRR